MKEIEIKYEGKWYGVGLIYKFDCDNNIIDKNKQFIILNIKKIDDEIYTCQFTILNKNNQIINCVATQIFKENPFLLQSGTSGHYTFDYLPKGGIYVNFTTPTQNEQSMAQVITYYRKPSIDFKPTLY